MKAVIDTNVFVSGLITRNGICGRIVNLILNDIILVCVDSRILDEYVSVLRRPGFPIDRPFAEAFLEFIQNENEYLTPLPLGIDLPDTKDLPFLEVAHSAAVLLVTGNKKHFPASACMDVHVITPAEFLDLLRNANR